MTTYIVFAVLASLMTAAASPSLFVRTDSSSCASSYSQCGSAFPADFCCSSSSTCLGVDSNSTVVCCPSGRSCDYIEPITCDVQQQNATLHPDTFIKTTRLTDKLSSCGDACCPFGYSCQRDVCSLDSETASSGGSTSTSTSTSTPISGSTSTSVSESTTTTPPSTFSTVLITITPAATAHSTSQPDKSPIGIIVSAVVAPLVVILTVAIIAIIFVRRRRASRRQLKSKIPSLYMIGNKAELPGESFRAELDGKGTMAVPFAQDNAINYGKPAELP